MDSIEFLPTLREYYSGGDILITGATGFFGKVLIEKLLRCCPEINKIYLILRKRRQQDVQERINEFKECEVKRKRMSNISSKDMGKFVKILFFVAIQYVVSEKY